MKECSPVIKQYNLPVHHQDLNSLADVQRFVGRAESLGDHRRQVEGGDEEAV